jgi:hypothetical protein
MATQTIESLTAVMTVQNGQLESRADNTVWRYIPNTIVTPMRVEVRANGAAWRFSPDQTRTTVWQHRGVNHAN